MALDFDNRAQRAFYQQIHAFSENAKTWHPNVIWYETKPDEMWDITLVSERVYYRRDEYLVVLAAAGLSSVEQPLPQIRIALPDEGTLYSIKRRCNFESIADRRRNNKPVWIS
mgnify:CR=1 FL=1